jgi:hypothetical protein
LHGIPRHYKRVSDNRVVAVSQLHLVQNKCQYQKLHCVIFNNTFSRIRNPTERPLRSSSQTIRTHGTVEQMDGFSLNLIKDFMEHCPAISIFRLD